MNKNLVQITREQTRNMKCVGKAYGASFGLCAFQAWKHGVNFQTEKTYYVIESNDGLISDYLPVCVSFWKPKSNFEIFRDSIEKVYGPKTKEKNERRDRKKSR